MRFAAAEATHSLHMLWPVTSLHRHGLPGARTFMTTAMRAMRSAACCRILALLLFRRHLIVPQIWGR